MINKMMERGYTVKENGPVYYTLDMDRTVKWFEDVLGWEAGIDQRGENGEGLYGCVLFLPHEFINMGLVTFNGFHMFCGEPSARVVAFIRVDNVENLRNYVLKNGWTQISEITVQPWGGKECSLTTIDGSSMRIFQID